MGVREQRNGIDELYLLQGDHDRKEHDSGSTSGSYSVNSSQTVTEKYKAWGEIKDGVNHLPTDYTFTGQYSNKDDFGLMYYRARWYDPFLGASLKRIRSSPAREMQSRGIDMQR